MRTGASKGHKIHPQMAIKKLEVGGKEGAPPTRGKDPTQKGLCMLGTEMVKTLFCTPLILLQVYYVWCILYFLAWSAVKPLRREDPVLEEEGNYSISGHGRRDGNSLNIQVRDRCHGERERREESKLRTLRSLVKEGDVARGCWSAKTPQNHPDSCLIEEPWYEATKDIGVNQELIFVNTN